MASRNLLMGDPRQQLGEVGHAERTEVMPSPPVFFIRIEIVCRAAKVGIEQQGAVVEATILVSWIGRSLRLCGRLRRFSPPDRYAWTLALTPSAFSALRAIDGRWFYRTPLASHKGKTGIAEIVGTPRRHRYWRRARRTLSSSIRRVLHSFHGFCARPITTVSALRQRNRTRCVAGIWRKYTLHRQS